MKFFFQIPDRSGDRRLGNIERVSRADNSMERLDDELFRLPGLIDYGASDTGCGLHIDAVGIGKNYADVKYMKCTLY